MRCRSCQAENQATRQYCRECGAPLSVVCRHCRFVNDPSDRFCGGCGRPLVVPDANDRAAGQEDVLPVGAERRQVTLVFVDLVGSTALSERLDPEDMRELYRSYREAAGAIIANYGGRVAQFAGDGILAYFGYPQAHEDDAVRAVHAALEAGPAVRELDGSWNSQGRVELAIRAGVHTGIIVAGTLGTGALAEPLAAVGRTSNIAARIQNYAEPGAVMITAATMRLIEGRFECEDLGRHPMRGVREPVHIFRVRRPSDRLTRFEAAKALSDLVGREAELELILERWSMACGGDRQLVLLSGEPGIGKSRLVRAVEEKIAGQPQRTLRCQCSPFTVRSTLQPVIVGLQRAAGFLPDDGPDERLDKLEAFLAAAGVPVERVAPLYAALLSVPARGRYPPLGLTPARQKELTLAALVDHVRALAAQQPVLLVVEDAHWIDPTSLELLDRLIPELAGARVLVLVTFRPELAHAWPAEAAEIGLRRLSGEESAALISRVLGGKAVPPEVEAEIVRKTEGVPLFIEELTRAVSETDALILAPERYELSRPLPTSAIPATLQESLLARLDRLNSAKELAQIAACIGREFPQRLLAEVAGFTPAILDYALERLATADLIARSAAPGPSFVFRHALIRDIAYGSLVRTRRQELHGRIALALPRYDPEIGFSQPELLAHHLTEAGKLDEAIDQWLRAGQRASALSANQEAVDHLSRGLELLKQLPNEAAQRRRGLQLLVSRGPAQIVLRGPATEEVAQTYAEALKIAASLPEEPAHFAAHWGWWFISPDHREQARRGAHLMALATRMDDPGLLMQAHHCQWATQLNLGKIEACRHHIEAGLELYEAGAYADEIALYGGHDAKVCGLGNAAIAAWLAGEGDLARQRVPEVLAWAARTDHAASRAHALESTSTVGFFTRDLDGLRSRAGEMLTLAEEQGFAGYGAKAAVYLGWALAQEGEVGRGLTMVRDGLDRIKATGTSSDSPFFAHIHAELLGLTGAVDEAIAEIDRTLAEMERGALQLWLPELQRLRGELAESGAPDEAEAWFERALASAVAQGARILSARAADSLARLRRRGGSGGDAAALLATAEAAARPKQA